MAPRRYPSPQERFRAGVERQDECLVWTKRKNTDGYGMFMVGGKGVTTHRFAWEQEYGPIPADRVLDHTCFNKACADTRHLRLATRSQNGTHLQGARRDNRSSGVRNVYPNGGGWVVRMQVDGRLHNYGTYPTIAEAEAVAIAKRRENFGDFAGIE